MTRNRPIVERDAEARAVYVRFSRKRVVETEVAMADNPTVALDLDAAGQVIGFELVGFEEFSAS